MAGRGAATPHDALIRRIGLAKRGNQANGRFRARFCPGKNAVGPVIQRSPNGADRKRFQRVLKPLFSGVARPLLRESLLSRRVRCRRLWTKLVSINLDPAVQAPDPGTAYTPASYLRRMGRGGYRASARASILLAAQIPQGCLGALPGSPSGGVVRAT